MNHIRLMIQSIIQTVIMEAEETIIAIILRIYSNPENPMIDS